MCSMAINLFWEQIVKNAEINLKRKKCNGMVKHSKIPNDQTLAFFYTQL